MKNSSGKEFDAIIDRFQLVAHQALN